jgi:hypothetical protein
MGGSPEVVAVEAKRGAASIIFYFEESVMRPRYHQGEAKSSQLRRLKIGVMAASFPQATAPGNLVAMRRSYSFKDLRKTPLLSRSSS